MKQQQIQLTDNKKIYAKLDNITKLLNKIASELEEIANSGTEIKLSKKAKLEIEKGLKELESGKAKTYKNWKEFDKALG